MFSSLASASESLENSELFQQMKREKFKGPEAKRMKDLRTEDGARPYKDCKTWADFYLKVQEQKRFFDAGLGFDSWDPNQSRAWRNSAPSWMLRPRAEKLLMRKEEVAELELDLMGKGAIFSDLPLLGKWPFGGLKDFAFGIFARGACLEQTLGKKWGRRDPDAVLASQSFYDDVVKVRHACELTLMVHVSREMELAEVTRKYGQALKSLAQRTAPSADLAPVDAFVELFNPQRIDGGVSWLTADKKVKEGTKLLLTAMPDGRLVGEVVSPGRIADQRVTVLGAASDPLVSQAVFQLFLGERALDPIAKKLVGKGCVFVANGHQFPKSMADAPEDAHTWFGDYKAPEVVEVDATPDAFALAEGGKGEDKPRLFLSSAKVFEGAGKKPKAKAPSAEQGEGMAGAQPAI